MADRILAGWGLRRERDRWPYPKELRRERWVAVRIDPRGIGEQPRLWLESGVLQLNDPVEYYPSGYYGIPLTVIDALRELGDD